MAERLVLVATLTRLPTARGSRWALHYEHRGVSTRARRSLDDSGRLNACAVLLKRNGDLEGLICSALLALPRVILGQLTRRPACHQGNSIPNAGALSQWTRSRARPLVCSHFVACGSVAKNPVSPCRGAGLLPNQSGPGPEAGRRQEERPSKICFTCFAQ